MLSKEDIVFQCFDATLKAGVTMLHCWKTKGKTNHLPAMFFFFNEIKASSCFHCSFCKGIIAHYFVFKQ